MGVKLKRKLSENENVDVGPKKAQKQQQESSENVTVKNFQAAKLDAAAADSSISNDGDKDQKQQGEQQQEQQKVQYRKRKKHFYNSIRNQMEFYFGDANLSKDRFLRQLIDKDPLVPLEIFLTFNKIKQITTNLEDIAKALKNSELLELDDAQQKVKRKTPIPIERNVDEKTLYVESLPPTADHEWLCHIFNRFGKIAYISLPKYTKSRKIKGFAFIEFESEQSVEKAVQTFKKFNSVLCMIEQDPSELCSIKTYIKEKEGKEETLTTAIKQSDTHEQLQMNTSEEPFAQVKKGKIETSQQKQQPADAVNKNGDSHSQTVSHLEDTASGNEKSKQNQPKQNKKKRRKKKKSTAEKLKDTAELNSVIVYNELKILPKIHWKRLRNKYLNLQRQCIKELKSKNYKEQQSTNHKIPQTLENHALQTINMNFYGAGDDNNQTKVEISKNASENSPLNNCLNAPKFETGLIVEIALIEPCDAKEFKAEMRQHTSIKYIDAKQGQTTVFIRMDTANAANDFIHKISCAEYQCKILSGDAEKEYWYKIERDRAQKLSKQVKIPPKRSRDKIQKLINKHIRFDDEDEVE